MSKGDSSSKIDHVSELVARALECEAAENFNPEEEDKLEVGEERAPVDGSSEHSVGKLLDGFYEKKIQYRGYSKMLGRPRERRGLIYKKKTKALFGEKVIEGEDPDELMASISSGDDEEALAAGTSSSNEVAFDTMLTPSSTGLFTKLQKVMQREKHKDADFQKNLHSASGPNCWVFERRKAKNKYCGPSL